MLTNFRTQRNDLALNYSTRGILILEFLKIRDTSIDNSQKMFQTVHSCGIAVSCRPGGMRGSLRISATGNFM